MEFFIIFFSWIIYFVHLINQSRFYVNSLVVLDLIESRYVTDVCLTICSTSLYLFTLWIESRFGSGEVCSVIKRRKSSLFWRLEKNETVGNKTRYFLFVGQTGCCLLFFFCGLKKLVLTGDSLPNGRFPRHWSTSLTHKNKYFENSVSLIWV